MKSNQDRMTSKLLRVAFLLRFFAPVGAVKRCFLNSLSKCLQKSTTFAMISATLSEKSGYL